MNTKRVTAALAYLYRIVEAGEKGYAVCAANLDHLGVKLLFKSYAQQRARFKDEILTEIRHLGSDIKPRSSVRGLIHRGRIDIFAALAPGKSEREGIILKEVTLGERTAVKAYDRTLKLDLPVGTRQMVMRQQIEVLEAVECVHLLRGKEGHRMLVRLFDTKNETARALQELENSGCKLKTVESLDVNGMEIHEGRGSTVLETSVSGAVGGALWGSVIGGLAATSMDWATHPGSVGMIQSPNMWSLIALAGILGGACIGMALGGVIGIGIKGEDSHQSVLRRERPKQVLLLTVVERSQVTDVQRILNRIGLQSALQVDETTA